MAQVIKNRRGPIGNLKAATSNNGELIVASGSISDLSGPFVFVGSPTPSDNGSAGAFKAVSKIYTGTNAPTISNVSYGTTLDGTPFYSTNSQSLYILNNDGSGNSELDLTGNIEGNSISSVSISTIDSSVEVTGDLTASNFELSGNADIAGNITLGGNIIIGDAVGDVIDFNGLISSSLIPSESLAFDLGSSSKKWNDLHIGRVVATEVSGAFSGSFSGNGSGLTNLPAGNVTFTDSNVVSSSVQVDHDQTTNFVAGEHFLQSDITTVGTVTVGSVTAILPSGTVSSSAQLTNTFLEITGDSVISSSAQIDHDATTNFDANEHFTQGNITTVGTVTSGDVSGILPSGTVSASAQVNADTITNFDTNVKAKMNTDGVVSSSAQVSALAGTSNDEITIAVGGGLNIEEADNTFTLNQTGDQTITINTAGSNIISSSAQITYGSSADQAVEGSTEITINGTANEIEITGTVNQALGSGPTYTIGLPNDITIGNNLIVENDVFISGSLTLLESAESLIISASTVELDDNVIRLNAFAPFQRYAGFEVIDSGSSGVSASLQWDSTNDYWLVESSSKQTGKLIATTYGTFGSETSLTSNTIPKATGPDHIGNSSLTDNGTTLAYNTNKFTVASSDGATTIAGNLTLSAAGGTDGGSNGSAVAFRNGSNVVGYVSTTETTDVLDGILGYKNTDGALVFSTVIDGGTF